MSRHQQMCPHCQAKAGLDGAEEMVLEPIVMPGLPEVPRPFMIHYPAGRHRDYLLHPDGRLTTTVGDQLLTSWLSFADMAESSWEGAHIEWDPEPLPVEPAPEPVPIVQAAIDLEAA